MKKFLFFSMVISVIWSIFWFVLAMANPFNIDSGDSISIGLIPCIIIPIILIFWFIIEILKTLIKKISKFNDYFFDFNIEEDKEKFIRNQRIRKIRIWKIKKVLKKSIKKFFKFLGWAILLFVICLAADYEQFSEKISIWFVIFMFTLIVNFYLCDIKNYKLYKSNIKKNEVDKRFYELWKPNILLSLILFWLGLRFGNVLSFLGCISVAWFIELWEKRFIISDIKQDLILEKLNSKDL